MRLIREFLAATIPAHAPSYLLTQLTHLSVGIQRLSPLSAAEMSTLRDTRASLARLLPLHPVRQAVPATPADVVQAELQDPALRGILVRLLWHSAARFSDWTRVLQRDVELLPRCWIRVRYRKTKTSARGIVRLAQFRLPPHTWSRLQSLLASIPPSSPPFPLRYTSMLRWLRRACPTLTLHSFRRGAVQRMLDAGVPPSEIARLTGHRSLQTLYGYADRLPRHFLAAMALAHRALE